MSSAIDLEDGREHAACRGTTTLLEPEEVRRELGPATAWALDADRLVRRVSVDSFAGAVEATIALSLLAERRNHHPAIRIDKRDIEVTLWTRKLGGVTRLDLDFAKAVDALMGERR